MKIREIGMRSSLVIRGLQVALIGFALAFISPFSWADYSLGTGFAFTGDGYIATNYHVIKDATTIAFRDSSGRMLRANVVKIDRANDLAILKVEARFQALPIGNSRVVKPGTAVITVGYPLVTIQGGEPKVTDGIISSLSGMQNDGRVYQISVPIQPGNSGGPLVNRDGNVIGIVTARLDALGILEATGSLPQNVNYALKSNYLLELAGAIEGIEKELAKPRVKPFTRTEDLVERVQQAIGIIIAETASAPKSDVTQQKSPTFLPPLWIETATGSRFRLRQSGDLMFFEKLNMAAAGNFILVETRMLGDNTAVGTLRVRASCVSPLLGSHHCDGNGSVRMTMISPDRIQGVVDYPNIECPSCVTRSHTTQSFTWIPN